MGPPPRAAAPSRSPADADSAAWVAALRSTGSRGDEALERLHELMVRAARFEVRRRREALAWLGEEELDALALHAAGDAMMALLRKLDDYRGDSRFTTWAYKFALLEAGVKVQRRRMWRRDVPLAPEGWERRMSARLGTAEQVQLTDLVRIVREAIRDDLTPHQRRVLVAVTIDEVPIDVLAERLSTTRGALYKTLHDARAKLRRTLAERDVDVAAALEEDRDGP